MTEPLKSRSRRGLNFGSVLVSIVAFYWGTARIAWAEGSWCLQPLRPVSSLLRQSEADPSAGKPIDFFTRRRLRDQGLELNPRAQPHRELRRLSLMLTGLPPSAAIASEFATDPSDDHYVRLVDHYLNSDHFGERWARHWMDVVRYAETWGYEWNHLVREAWRYRDYLIRAFNQDVPFDQLIREHIAGDLLDPPRVNPALGINESLIGTAFYRFGETGHDDCVLYPEISLDVMDNQIDTLSKAFQALTVSCSRCHDHKLDDIPQRDYYRLLGVMASSRQAILTLNLPQHQHDLKRALLDLKRRIRQELGAIWMRQAEGISAPRLQELLSEREASDGEHIEDPLYAWKQMSGRNDGDSWQLKWRQLHHAILAEGERRERFNRTHFVTLGDFTSGSKDQGGWEFDGLSVASGACCSGPGQFSVLYDGANVIDRVLPGGLFSHTLSEKLNAVVRSPLLPTDKKFVSYFAMGQRGSVCRTVIANCTLPYFHTNRFRSNTLEWSTVDLAHVRKSPLVPFQSYLEWATALDDQGYPVLNMPQSEYHSMLDNPRSWFGMTKVVAHDVERPPYPHLRAQTSIFASPVSGERELAERYRDVLKAAIARWTADLTAESDVFWINAFLELDVLTRAHDQSPALEETVAEYRRLEATVETPKRIVGMSEPAQGFDVPLLEGGQATAPQEVVERGYLGVIERRLEPPVHFKGSGRLQIAQLVAHPRNPLTSRVMANRIWHYLFGQGIVHSVDNFGNLGELPTHPELLDYLAGRLIDSGWSVKTVIREIALSDTFRQSSRVSRAAAHLDAENNLLHHYPSRRLEAEVIRDAMLSVSGRLDATLYGPSVDPYRLEDTDSRKLYAGPLDGEGRRSLYIKVTRMGPSKFLELFNCPDPSMTRGKRDRTNVPAQALGLMNHPFVHQMADLHAQRLLTNGAFPFDAMLENLFLRVLSRRPSDLERGEYREFFHNLEHDRGLRAGSDAIENIKIWKDLIHALYNLKEFSYVL